MVDDLFFDPQEANDRYGQTHDLGNGEAPPHGVQTEVFRQEVRSGQQNYHLTHYRNDKSITPIAQSLKYTTDNDADPGKEEAQRDPAQCRYAHGDHRIGCGEHFEQRFGEEHKEDHTNDHQRFR